MKAEPSIYLQDMKPKMINMRSTGSSTVHRNITNAHETKDSTGYRPCIEKKDESGNPENMQKNQLPK